MDQQEINYTQKLYSDYTSSKDRLLLPKAKIEKHINRLKTLKNDKNVKKTREDYYLLERYAVLEIGDIAKLIKKQESSTDPVKYFAAIEDTYDIVKRTHTALNHAGREKMLKELKKKYANVTKTAVELFKSLCEECQPRQKNPNKGVVVKPIVSQDFNSRGQIDLLDMQSMPDGSCKFIMNYQDRLTKFCIIEPLTSKRAAEVAYKLLNSVFLVFGAPHILQSDNGREFTAYVISELKQLWPELVIVHGRPRHPQSQGSIERSNADIHDMLVSWMRDNETTKWSHGIKFVQFQKNRRYHEGIKRSPYEAMFGCPPKVGLTSSSLPNEVLALLTMEEHLTSNFQNQTVITNSTNGASATSITNGPAVQGDGLADLTGADARSSETAEVTHGGSSDNDVISETAEVTRGGSSDTAVIQEQNGVTHPVDPTGADARSSETAEVTHDGSSDNDVTSETAEVTQGGSSDTAVIQEQNDVTHPVDLTGADARSSETAEVTHGGSSDNDVTSETAEVTQGGSSDTAVIQQQNDVTHPVDLTVDSQSGESESHTDNSVFHQCGNCDADTTCQLCQRATRIRRQRHSSGEALKVQADRMVKRSNRILRPVAVGDNVLVPIPSVDRERGDPRNIPCCVLEHEGDSYKLGTAYGTLDKMVCRSQFTPTPFQGLHTINVKEDLISVRGAAKAQSIGDGQGFVKCACKTGCKTKACKCHKSAVLCNSKCHSSLSCSNKND